MPACRRLLLATALLLPAPALALAYGVAIHNLLPRHALHAALSPRAASGAGDSLAGVTDADVAAFRRFLYERASRLRDGALRAAFVTRYPTADAFGPGALKEFLMMNGEARVLGVDSFASVYRVMVPQDRRMDPHHDYQPGHRIALADALELGSIYPDLDRRNQNRLLRDASGAPVLTAGGDSVPFDPMTLNMGRLTGLSSQAHAHYGLNRQPKSDDPEVLKREPWNFAIASGFPGAVETYGPWNAQLYADLSLLAALDGRPGFRTLGVLFAGNSFHYVADVGNAVHTIQVGIYPIFVEATVQSWLRRVLSLFGLLGRTRSRNEIGLDIIANLHTLSEELFQEELTSLLRDRQRGSGAAPPPGRHLTLRALEQGDDSLARALADTLAALADSAAAPDFGRAIAHSLIDANYRDGAEVYRITRGIIVPRLRKGRQTVDFDTIPDDQVWRFARGGRANPALDTFNLVHARGIARTTSALRAWWSEYQRLSLARGASRERIMDALTARLVAERLAYLAEAERRRRIWMTRHDGDTPR